MWILFEGGYSAEVEVFCRVEGSEVTGVAVREGVCGGEEGEGDIWGFF